MTSRLAAWLVRKWERQPQSTLLQDYLVTFSTPHGRRVLTHLLDQVYCTTYEGQDQVAMAIHTGRRSLVQEILENIDRAEHQDTYQVQENS